jgi:hypothetical protein
VGKQWVRQIPLPLTVFTLLLAVERVIDSKHGRYIKPPAVAAALRARLSDAPRLLQRIGQYSQPDRREIPALFFAFIVGGMGEADNGGGEPRAWAILEPAPAGAPIALGGVVVVVRPEELPQLAHPFAVIALPSPCWQLHRFERISPDVTEKMRL